LNQAALGSAVRQIIGRRRTYNSSRRTGTKVWFLGDILRHVAEEMLLKEVIPRVFSNVISNLIARNPGPYQPGALGCV
ncbi:Hypothetical predicted protein, partial [Paramuricea clavata]